MSKEGGAAAGRTWMMTLLNAVVVTSQGLVMGVHWDTMLLRPKFRLILTVWKLNYQGIPFVVGRATRIPSGSLNTSLSMSPNMSRTLTSTISRGKLSKSRDIHDDVLVVYYSIQSRPDLLIRWSLACPSIHLEINGTMTVHGAFVVFWKCPPPLSETFGPISIIASLAILNESLVPYPPNRGVFDAKCKNWKLLKT